jgi:DNA transformation protein
MPPPTHRRSPSIRSLASSKAFETFVLDQLADLGEVTHRKMFGGVGLYCGGWFFGIIARDELYLKTDEQTRSTFGAAGSHPFKPYADRPVTMQYFAVPVEILESAPELVTWARAAVAVAHRAK